MKDGYHHGNLKEQLILAGIDMINRDGIEGLSLRRAADKCGVSHGAPYSHFKDKNEYLMNINAFVEEEFSKALTEAGDRETGDNTVVKMAKAYVRFFSGNPNYYKFFMDYADFRINISETEIICENSRPFEIFRSAAQEYLKGLPKDRMAMNIIKMWAMVQGITILAVMPSVSCHMDWEDYTQRLICADKEDNI